jgi:hypothetical protein
MHYQKISLHISSWRVFSDFMPRLGVNLIAQCVTSPSLRALLLVVLATPRTTLLPVFFA